MTCCSEENTKRRGRMKWLFLLLLMAATAMAAG